MATTVNSTSSASAQLQSLARSLMSSERIPLTRLESQKEEQQSRIEAYRALGSKLSDLLRVAQDFSLPGRVHPLHRMKVSGSGASDVDAAVGSTAEPGVHTVEVRRLASAHTLASEAVSASETASAAGETARFRIHAGGKPVEIEAEIASGATWDQALDTIARAINASDEGLRASVLRTSDGERRLLIQATEGGAVARITSLQDVEGDWMRVLGLSGGAGKDGRLAATVQEGDSAEIVVDGQTITSSTNKLENVLPGLTLTLRQAGGGVQTLVIERDEDAVVEAVKGFIEKYNAALREVRSRTQPADPSGSNRGLLAGDIAFVRLRTELRSAALTPVQGLDGTFDRLAQLGVAADRDGTLRLSDESALREAVRADGDGVEALFREGMGSRLEGVLEVYSRTGGLLTRQQQAARTRIQGIEGRITRTEEILARREAALIQQLADLQAAVGSLSRQQQYLSGLLASSDSLYA